MTKPLPSKKLLLEKYSYEKKTGIVVNKKTGIGPQKDRYGYLYIGFYHKGISRMLKIHRLVYFFETNKQPEYIDHKNGDREDNRFENLRSATVIQNGRNRKPNKKKEGTSKYKL